MRVINRQIQKGKYWNDIVVTNYNVIIIDLKDGFHRVEVAEWSRKYTFFISPLDQYGICKIPFKLCNEPGIFQRYINNIFNDLIWSGKVIVYFDDIVIATKTLEDQLVVQTQVFKLMNNYKLQMRLYKCQFLKVYNFYFGNLVDLSGINANPKNVSVV